ncbi:MAG: ABC transporter permease [Polyangiaceae bacterium]|nr:ABC transporter permease [Polyangiaceae bacterium]
MGFSLELALRYLGSKKRDFVSLGTVFAILGVSIGVAALTTVVSVTGGFRAQFRDKVLGVNAHVLVLKHTSDFREYRDVMDQVRDVPGVIGIAPFVINPMMVTRGDRTATGVLLKGVDPERMGEVLDLPRYVVRGSLDGLRLAGSRPPAQRRSSALDDPWSVKRRPLPAASGGARDEPDGGVPFLKALERAIASDGGATAADAGVDHRDAGAGPADAGADSDDDPAAELGAPIGDVEPDGGYASVLPDDDDDDLPADVDPDPCASAEAAGALPGIVIGSTLERTLDAKVGDCVQVTSPTIGFSYRRGAMRAPVAKQFRVIAIFEAGFDQYDSKLVYTDLYEAQAFADSGDSVTGVEMKIADIDRAKEVGVALEAKLANGVYNIVDWEELNRGLFTALRIQQILMSIVLGLIIVVAAFTVIATLIMVVLDKKKEIAVLKAMGATDGALLRAFLWQGAIIGGVGTGVGLLLGWASCRGLEVWGFPLDPKVYFISKLPVQMRLDQFGWIGLFALLVCVGATVWPALHAARLRPAEAFREV